MAENHINKDAAPNSKEVVSDPLTPAHSQDHHSEANLSADNIVPEQGTGVSPSGINPEDFRDNSTTHNVKAGAGASQEQSPDGSALASPPKQHAPLHKEAQSILAHGCQRFCHFSRDLLRL